MSDFSKSELSDKAILDLTEVETQAATGRMRFLTTLPSGRKLESEWFQESSKTRWLLKWCGAVNDQIRIDQQEEMAKQRRQASERKSQRALAGVPSAEPGSPLTFPSLGSGTESSTSAAPFLTSDPFAFLNQALDLAEQEAMRCRQEADAANKALERAETNLKKWKAAHASLNVAPTE